MALGLLVGSEMKVAMRYIRIGTYLVCVIAMHSAKAGGQAESPSLVVSKNGAHVSDLRSKLIWSRCVEGMQWDGKTCTGKPTLASHAEALSLARARAETEGLSWRVPRVKELQRLVNTEKEETVFPVAPPGWHWTVSANIDTRPINQYDYGNIGRGITEQSVNRMAFLHGWAVSMGSGQARGDISKRTKLPVRLVRQEN